MDSPYTRIGWTVLVYLAIGCGSTRTSRPVLPAPSLPPVINPSSTGSWTFNYAPGALRYQVSRSAAIESQSDSGSNREISTNITHELVTLTPIGDSAIGFTAVVDTFSSTTQGRIGPVQPIQLPVQVSGILADSGFMITSDGSSDRCNPVSSAIVSDLHNLLTRFPALLSRGLVWKDSVSATGCQAAIPTTSHTTRSYVVSGESIYDGQPVLVVQRTDTIQAQGEGAQQQHSLKLNARGGGSAIYYLDTKDGRLIRLTTSQELVLTITASGKAHQFKQSSRQDFRLAP
ncbi:MAG: hypothetical protein M3R67_13990 [Acidobacteriota bacterium]|nr:hypothetical protein [Acidobacteriota bacterium]